MYFYFRLVIKYYFNSVLDKLLKSKIDCMAQCMLYFLHSNNTLPVWEDGDFSKFVLAYTDNLY